MKTTHIPSWAGLWAIVIFVCLCSFGSVAISQTPTVTVRFANPAYDCASGQYCVDVEFLADTTGVQIFGMNVRFFYPDTLLELVGFSDFQGGYGPVSPDPPMIVTSASAGPGLFNFVGPADWVNGAIQLTNLSAPPIILDTLNWTFIFRMCFTIDDPNPNIQSFCPALVWDLEQDPANGGFLVGDDGVVITEVDPLMIMESVPTNENVIQHNWKYIGMGSPPFGTPFDSICISLDCSPMITCAVDTTIECNASTDPMSTGSATATDICAGDPILTFSDSIVPGNCPNNYTLVRTWIASNECNLFDTCVQLITVIDTTAPTITCPPDLTIECVSQVPLPDSNGPTATDNCSGPVAVGFVSDITVNQTCTNRFTIHRTYRASDQCGNSSTCIQSITVNDQTAPMITCPSNVSVSCANLVPGPNPSIVTALDNCGGTPTIIFGGDVITNQTCINRYQVTRTYRATDACGNSATCSQIITVNDVIPPGITCPANVTITSTDSTLPANTGIASGQDNCGGTPTIVFNDMIVAGSCVQQFGINRTWTATDACNNSATCLQTISVAGGCNLDLSLTKLLNAGQGTITGGDNVNFTITVTNQGIMPVGSISIVDYIPIGFTLNDPDWTAGTAGSTGQSATIVLSIANGALAAGGLLTAQNVSVVITLKANANIAMGLYTNVAEIDKVLDINDVDVSNEDVDSTPDDNDTNDPVTEDDHSPASVCVTTIPIITGDEFSCPGDTVLYVVNNYNPLFSYFWEVQSGGMIISNTGSAISVVWQDMPGGPFVISVTVVVSEGCEATGTFNAFTQGAGPLACIDHINLSIDNECGTVVTSGMILTGDEAGDNSYSVVIMDLMGHIIPNATFTWEDVGKTFKVLIKSHCSGQSCWGLVTVEDKFPPVINCVCPVNNDNAECSITCREISQILDGNIPDNIRPTVVDNCGGTTLNIINTNLIFDYCTQGSIQVTWKATDASGNMSTCLQEFHIIPLTLETLKFPPDYNGTCGGSSDPSVTGWPMVNGMNLDLPAGVCNLSVTYKDLIIDLCGNGIKIQRTWRVADWCTGRVSIFPQNISLPDHQGPVLTCSADITVGTDVWYCYANVLVPKPVAIDACSKIASYKLFSGEGTIVTIGQNFVINQLAQGTHKVKWVVADECGNESTCTMNITVVDDVPPVASCQQHTIISLTSERPNGITLIPASAFNDGSFDNCGPVTFRARRMDSCIDFDWTTGGACVDEIPGGFPAVNGKDRGTDRGPCIPFGCCDVGVRNIMVELEVTDDAGNVNYCMVLVDVQDKLAPNIECPPDVTISCDYLLNIQEGTFVDADGNNDGSLDEDPLSAIFGNVYDAFRHVPSDRKNIIIDDPGNTDFHQPHNWGIDGWATDNCESDLSVKVSVIDDCTGASFPGQPPSGARKLIERRFRAYDGVTSGTCLQRIWVVDFNPFHINDVTCNNDDPNDGVIWPCDVLLNTCPSDLSGTGEPTLFDDNCSIVGVSHEDTRYNFADSACYKVLREWKVIDWCQYNPATGYGLWSYIQTIKVMDGIKPEFLNCPQEPLQLCTNDPGIRLPSNNQIFLGENNPNASSCSVQVTMTQRVHEDCSEMIFYDVKVYPFNGNTFIQMVPTTSATLDSNHEVDISFDTEQSSIPSIAQNGLPYNSPLCGDYHRVVWTVADGCGNVNYCDYLFRLEDCKKPTPVCIDGISTVVMGPQGSVTISASNFNASSYDDCTPGDELLFSFSGTTYEPTFTYTCDNVPVFGAEMNVAIWAADGGSDLDCDGQIEWSERNKDLCITTIVVTDNNNFCGQLQSMLAGEIFTDHNDAVEKVIVNVSSPQQLFPSYTTSGNGKFEFTDLPLGQDYTITPQRNDDYKNGVSTLDLVQIQKHLLGREVFTSPYEYIAADANNSKSVSALDILELRKLVLGLYTELPNNDSWRFIDKNYVIPDPANPWLFNENLFIQHWQGNSTNNDFIAVKIGDVNNTVKANALQVIPRGAERLIEIKAETKDEAKVGEIVELKLTFPEIVNGFQWTFETDGLDYVGVSSGEIQIDDSNVGLLGNGITTMSWNGEVLTDGKPKQNMSFMLRWKVTTPGKIRNKIRLTSLVTPAESYTPEGEILKVKLAYSNLNASTDFNLYQNKPNPWNGQTTIGFDLPNDGPAELTIFDVTGKVVTTVSGNYNAGYNTIVLTAKDVPSTGVMYYRLQSGGYSASKKMVLIR